MTPFLIRVRFEENLRVSNGRLTAGRGTEVHAATFLRQRLVILDRELLQSPSELKRIWIHELFHFVWQRLANQRRRSWEELLLQDKSRGELGWSAQWRKDGLTAEDRELRTQRWREYCCESFCDTAAWLAGEAGKHPEATLGPRYRAARQKWFAIIQK